MLLLVPVKEPNKANIDQIVNSLSDSIAKGDLEVTRVNSLVGKDGVPYLTQAHLDSLKKVGESVNRNIDTRMVEYDSGYTAGMVYVKYPSGVRGEIQIVGEKVLDIANAEHIPYDAFLGKPYAGAFPKENLGKASEILDPIRTAATSLDEVQKAKYLGYLNSQYTRARQIEQGASPAAVNLPEGISGKLSVDNLIKANGALNQLKATNINRSAGKGERYYNGGFPVLEGSPYSPSTINSRSAEFYRFYGDGNQMRGAWSNLEVRTWYNAEDQLLPRYIDRSLPLELQAKQGFDMRNINRDRARELMYDRAGADRLYREEPNKEWNSFIRYKESKGLQGDDVYRSILQTMTKTRSEVNKLYDLD